MLRPREKKNNSNKKLSFFLFSIFSGFKPEYDFSAQPSSYGHTTVKAPHPIRTAKLSTVGPDQYFGRGLQGNLGCCMSFLILQIFFFKKIKNKIKFRGGRFELPTNG